MEHCKTKIQSPFACDDCSHTTFDGSEDGTLARSYEDELQYACMASYACEYGGDMTPDDLLELLVDANLSVSHTSSSLQARPPPVEGFLRCF